MSPRSLGDLRHTHTDTEAAVEASAALRRDGQGGTRQLWVVCLELVLGGADARVAVVDEALEAVLAGGWGSPPPP